jgi:hypothetical protein
MLENELKHEDRAGVKDPALHSSAELKEPGSRSSSSRPSKDAARDEKGAPAKGVGFVGAQDYWEGVHRAQPKRSSDDPGHGNSRGAKGGESELPGAK